jgi:hypothetical protein
MGVGTGTTVAVATGLMAAVVGLATPCAIVGGVCGAVVGVAPPPPDVQPVSRSPNKRLARQNAGRAIRTRYLVSRRARMFDYHRRTDKKDARLTLRQCTRDDHHGQCVVVVH